MPMVRISFQSASRRTPGKELRRDDELHEDDDRNGAYGPEQDCEYGRHQHARSEAGKPAHQSGGGCNGHGKQQVLRRNVHSTASARTGRPTET